MAKKRKSYKCGNCGELGHNKRACPKKETVKESTAATEEPTQVKEAEPKTEAEEESVDESKPQPQKVAVSASNDLTADLRKEPDSRPARPPSPFECPTCGRVGILALVETDVGQTLLRCEHCYTQCRPVLIHKWGALPEDKPAEQEIKRSRGKSPLYGGSSDSRGILG